MACLVALYQITVELIVTVKIDGSNPLSVIVIIVEVGESPVSTCGIVATDCAVG